jgi:Tol biopolymer transport system component
MASSSEWQRVWALFEEALERPAAERLTWLAQRSSVDPEARRQVEQLLAAHLMDGGLLDQPLAHLMEDALTAGGQAGPYRILNEIGRGGMGVVYRAEDPRLGRYVALKSLPLHLLSDEKAKQRFVSEAQAASRLDHPNICTIHDIGETNDGRLFFAMAYYEGKTVAERIAEGPLPVEEAVKIAIQVARGLEYAHREGVTHRDIKPSNILLAAHGEAKILDFGLAKRPLSQLSEPGVRLGTVPYMSPQQARGEPVDHRTDLWSLGVMLYEMLTGRLPFTGESQMTLLDHIINDNPPPLPAGIPEPLRKVVSRLLAKKTESRYHNAVQVVQALAHVQPGSWWRTSPILWYAGGLALVFGAVLAVGVWMGLWGPRPASPAQFQLVPFTSFPGSEWGAAFSPDGTQVAFSWNGAARDNYDIYIKPISSAEPFRLTTSPAMEASASWSPNGQHIAFLRARTEGNSDVLIMPASGGLERKLATVDATPWMGLSWSPDGKYVASPDRLPNHSVGVTLITVIDPRKQSLTEAPPGSVEVRNPAFSHDGGTLAFESIYSPWRGDILLVPSAGGVSRQLTNLDGLPQGLAWTPDGGQLVYAKLLDGRRSFWRQPLAGGQPERVAAGSNPSHPTIAGARLVFTERASSYDIVRIDVEHSQSNPPVSFLSSSRFDGNPQYSPDGSSIAFASSRSGQAEIWVANADGSGARQLTSLGVAGSPRWSPDGKHIAFDAPARDQAEIYLINASGGQPRRVTAARGENTLPAWSGDGRWLYFTSNRSGRLEVWRVPSQAIDDPAAKAVQVTEGGGLYPSESPDGKFVYYAKERRDRTSIWRVPVAGGEGEPVIEDLESGWGSWQVTGDGVYFANRRARAKDDAWAVHFFDFARRRVIEISRLPEQPSLDGAGFSVSPDRRWILCGQAEFLADLMLVNEFW